MIPRSLRVWFVIHFVLDMLFAIPLLFFPNVILSFFGLPIEPVMARLVGAALVGIGGASFLVRNKGAESFDSLLTVKILWSFSAVVGLVLSGVFALWPFVLVFSFFCCVWSYYKFRL